MASRFDDEEKPTAKVVALPPKKPEPLFPYTWVGDAVLKFDTKPIIKGLLDPGAFAMVYGPSGSGKSFFTADLAQHIALGIPWRGRKVTQGTVVYVASEAGSSILKRFVGWRDNRLSETTGKIPLAVLTRGPNLIAGTDPIKFEEQLQAIAKESELPVTLTIFDTLSRSMAGGDENKAEHMTKVIECADSIRDKFNCASLFVHHTGKDQEKGARGHSSLFAAADLVLKIMDKTATVEKVRDGVAGEQFGFALEPVQIGTDSDGEAVMTCLLNATDGVAIPKAKQPTGQNQKVVFPVVQALSAASDKRSPGTSTIPKGVMLIELEDVMSRAVDKFGGDDPKWRVRDKIKTALVGLQANGLIAMHSDKLWLL